MLSESQRVIQTEPHVVSGIALRMEANMWKPWLPEPDHPLFDGFKTMQAHSFARAYEQQQRLLNRIEDRNIFVAKCSCIRRLSPERANTFCTWTSGITSWLPRTDWIAFVQILDENTEQVDVRGFYEWDRVAQVMGQQMEPLGDYPPRYEVIGFPTDEQCNRSRPGGVFRVN